MKNNSVCKPFAVSFLAKSGTGKTTLIEKLIHIFAEKNYRVSSIKHTDHKFEADIKGKDSWRHKHAGAFSTMLLSDNSMAFFSDIKKNDAPDCCASDDAGDDSNINNINMIDNLINKFFNDADILIVEGFRDITIPKVELFRKELNPELRLKYTDDANCILVCGDVTINNLKIPQININQPDKIAIFLEKFIKDKMEKTGK
jgi:molybdopterin-guanine dinucleotide biosynthesis protein